MLSAIISSVFSYAALQLALQKLNNRKIYIYYIKRNEDISSKGSRSSIVILNGKIIDKYNQAVIKTGEIIKAKTLKILSKKFQIKNKMFNTRSSLIKNNEN